MRPGLLRVDGHAVWILLKKTKIPYDSTRWARKPLRPVFSVHAGAPVFTHTQGRRFPSNCETCSGKPIKVFLCTKCLLLQACYPSFARRWNGTPRTVCCKYAHGTALWRTSFRKHCPSRSRLLRQERIGKGLCCKPKKSPSRSSVLDADKSFLPLGRNVFRHRALSVEKNKGTP